MKQWINQRKKNRKKKQMEKKSQIHDIDMYIEKLKKKLKLAHFTYAVSATEHYIKSQ